MKAAICTSLIALVLAGCGDDVVVDQCLRIKLAQQCMKDLPKGPTHLGTSNDWDEVVQQCDKNAHYQAKRLRKFVSEECAL